MKSLRKYAIVFTALMAAAVVEAQAPPKAVPPAVMKQQVEEMEREIAKDNRHVLHLQAIARKEKDVIKLTCINDKLVQIKAQQNLFDSAALMLEGVAENETAMQMSLDDMTKIASDVKKLRGEADGCAGELEMYKQESRTDVERPELDDPTDGQPFMDPEQVGEPDIDVPGYATPFH